MLWEGTPYKCYGEELQTSDTGEGVQTSVIGEFKVLREVNSRLALREVGLQEGAAD